MNVEEAYNTIAKNVLVARAPEDWDQINFDTKILSKNCSSMSSLLVNKRGSDVSFILGMPGAFDVDSACIFIRDDTLRTTGERIWGLAFTLHSTGKFHIKYNYDKPDDYEDSEEIITGEEINESLNRLQKKSV